MLTPEEIELYRRQGFLVVPNFSSPTEVETLRQAGLDLVAKFDPSSVSSVFSTRNQKAYSSNQYFLDSANGIGYFLEEGALSAHGELTKPKEVALNKIGHALHDLDPAFKAWARSEKIASLLRSLGYRRPLPVQSMFIFKPPGIGGEVVPHQDSTFLCTDPPSVVGLWIALEDATLENGCLWGLPGSHKNGVIRRFIRAPDGSVDFQKGRGDMPQYGPDLKGFEPIEVSAGDLVLLHGANIHASKENTSDKSRHAFSVHFAEGAPGFEWKEDNWLQRNSDFPFVPLYDDTVSATGA